MRFTRRLPIVLFVALGCQMDNPGFEAGDGAGDQEDVSTDSEGESGSSLGESTSDGVDTSSSDGATSSSDGVDTSSSDGSEMSSSEGVDTSSSEGVDTSSSEEADTSSSDGLDAPIMTCALVEPVENCLDCMQNNCCEEADVACFDGNNDVACFCVLKCLSEGGMDCAIGCGAGPLPAGHAEVIYECGLSACGNTFCF